MKIAIVGAGFCGLAVAFFLGELGQTITIFDGRGIGGGASGIAAGLMHPFAGRFANLNFNGREGMAATKELLDISSKALGEEIADYNGLLRIVTTQEQKKTFDRCSKLHSDVLWKDTCQEISSDFLDVPGILITTAVKVNCPKYLQGLWKSCRNTQLHQVNINTLNELNEYDMIIVTTGAFKGLIKNSYTQVKGHILEYEWPWAKPLPLSINSQVYLVMGEKNQSIIAGSTFEKNFDSIEPDFDSAREQIDSKAKQLYPKLSETNIIGCRSGIRASTPNHLPIIQQMDHRVWTLTGMGSKGLLYHALYGKELVEKILNSI